MMAWAAIPKPSLASPWTSSRKLTHFLFARLKTSFWNLCLAVIIDKELTQFQRKAAKVSPRFFGFWLLLFLNVCNSSAFMRERRWLILLSAVGWFWILRLVSKKSLNKSKFLETPSKAGIVVVSHFRNLKLRWMLLLKLAELLKLASCCRTNKNWFALIVATVFSMRKCGWLAERAFLCLHEDFPWEQ